MAVAARIGSLPAGRDDRMLTHAAHVMMVAYSTFPNPFRAEFYIMSQPPAPPPMAASFVTCVLEEQPGGAVPRAAMIFKADVDFDCPQMPDFIFQLIDTVGVIRKLSRRSNARVVTSRFVLSNPLAKLDREKCQDIFYWQYLGHTPGADHWLM